MSLTRQDFTNLTTRFTSLSTRLEQLMADPNFKCDDVIQGVRGCFIQLPKDPLALGLNAVNELIAAVQAYKDYVKSQLMLVIGIKNQYVTLERETERLYLDKTNNIIQTHPEIRGMKNKELCKAATDAFCTDEIWLSLRVLEELDKVDACYQVCRIMNDNLNSTNDNLQLQITIIRQMSYIGETPRPTDIPTVKLHGTKVGDKTE